MDEWNNQSFLSRSLVAFYFFITSVLSGNIWVSKSHCTGWYRPQTPRSSSVLYRPSFQELTVLEPTSPRGHPEHFIVCLLQQMQNKDLSLWNQASSALKPTNYPPHWRNSGPNITSMVQKKECWLDSRCPCLGCCNLLVVFHQQFCTSAKWSTHTDSTLNCGSTTYCIYKESSISTIYLNPVQKKDE